MIRSLPTRLSSARLLRLAWLSSAGAALAMPGAAHAQAFNATPATQFGSVTYNRATPGVETIQVNSNSAVILWRPTAGTFLPAGNTATFQRVGANFAVLNRIVTAAGGGPITIDGNIISRNLSAIPTTAGTVIFFAPNGLIIGPNANINVGSLVLTSADPLLDGAGNFLSPDGTIQFQRVTDAGSAVTIQAGAQINAAQAGGYVLAVAPQVTQGGTVRVDTSAAYVSAEAATTTYNNGLFDIVVANGTTVDTGISHTGSTTGAASAAAASPHRIYMVGVPAQQATQLLLSGTVGFDAPVSATVENGAIILSAGYNIINDQPQLPDFGGEASNILINGGSWTSDAAGYATGQAAAVGAVAFSQDLTLRALNAAIVNAGASVLTIGGNLVLANDAPVLDPTNPSRTGGTVLLQAQTGGQVQVAGSALLDASGNAVALNPLAGNGQGGTATVNADGGTIAIAGGLGVLANGTATPDLILPDSGGAGTGGTAQLNVSNKGAITVGGALNVEARGVASAVSGTAGNGPIGRGGAARVGAASGGTLIVAGASTIDASGTGGRANGGFARTGGAGFGGTIDVSAGTTGQIAITGALAARALGTAGFGGTGGAGTGGTATLSASGGSQLSIGTGSSVDVTGTGGDGGVQEGGAGGVGNGGTVVVQTPDAGAGGRIDAGSLALTAIGRGGTGSSIGPVSPPGIPGGIGGAGVGGSISLLSGPVGGTIVAGAVTADASGLGGNGGVPVPAAPTGNGGAGTGGTVTIGIAAPVAPGAAAGTLTLASLTAAARGVGGVGLAGGVGAGGRATLTAPIGTVQVTGATSLDASGVGGAAQSAGATATGGNGQGGTAEMLGGGGLLTIGGSAALNASGTGGDIQATGTAGAGRGGTAQVTATGAGARVQVAGGLDLNAQGMGGVTTAAAAGATQNGGSGTGGNALVTLSAGGQLAVTGAAALSADGVVPLKAGNIGAATGGTAAVNVGGAGSSFGAGSAWLHANGTSITPAGGFTPLTGGAVTGGAASLTIATGGTATLGNLAVPGFPLGIFSLVVQADGLAPSLYSNGAGGAATGGTAAIAISGGTLNAGSGAYALAQGVGGSGTTGGNGTGGTADFTVSGGSAVTLTGGLAVDANGSGGASAGNAGAGGAGQGGTARARVATGTLNAQGAASFVRATGTGGAGLTGGVGQGGGALASANGGTLDVTGALSLAASGQGGAGVTAGGQGRGGTADIVAGALGGAAGSIVQLGSIQASALGQGGASSAGPGGAGQGGAITVGAVNGGAVTIGTAGASTLDASASGGGGAGSNGTAGSISATAAAGTQLALLGNFTARAVGTGGGAASTGTGGSISIQSAGTTTLGSLTADASSGGPTGNGGSINLGATGSLTYTGINATALGGTATGIQLSRLTGAAAGSNLTATTSGPLGAANVTAANNISLSTTPGAGALTATNVTAGGALALSSTTGALAATNVNAGTNANLTTTTGTLTATGVTAGQAATLTTGGGALNATNVTAGAALTLSSGSGALNANTVRGGSAAITTTSGSLTANGVTTSTGGAALATGGGNLSASNVAAATTATLASGAGTLAATNVTAGQAVTATTTRAATLAGVINAPVIGVSSSDIAIQAGAAIGSAGSAVTLNIVPTGAQSIFGGATNGAGYTLDATEIGLIRGASLTLVAPPQGVAANRLPDLLIRGVTVDAGRIANLTIDTIGIVQVEGALLLANAGAGSTLRIGTGNLAQRIQLVTPVGSVRVQDAAGAPGGALSLAATDIWAVEPGMLGQLLANPNFAGRNQALLTNGGAVAPRGYVEGGDVTLRAANSLFVQNTGDIANFGGVTIGTGGLTINAGSALGPAQVYAFGRRMRPNGSVSTNQVFFFEVNYNGTYTNDSEFNRCIINTRACPRTLGPTPPDQIRNPIGGSSGNGSDGMAVRLPPIGDLEDLINDGAGARPLIEEPVTSGGDSSAWIETGAGSRDEDDDDKDEPNAPVVTPAPPARPGAGGSR
jgi:filamentous hemagglutinin family protein